MGDRELVNFASNDYLNLAADPRLARASARAARRYGCGAGASSLVSGYLPHLRSLERALANWEGTESALVFASGYVANLALITALANQDDVIFSDELNHASLIDGCRLSRASTHVYPHRDVNHLADLLKKEGGKGRHRFIVTDTVFSMEGDLAPLTDLLDLAERNDCLVIIDEAHATGVLGEEGQGLCSPTLVQAAPDRIVKVGTLSKALGCQGGFVCGPKVLIQYLINFARPYIYSTALAPPLAAAARRAVTLMRKEPDRRRRLLNLADHLRQRLRETSWTVGDSHCQIVPIILGASIRAMKLSARLQKEGFLAPAIRPPSVPEGTARVRISLTAGHTKEDVDRLVDSLRPSVLSDSLPC